MRQEGPIPIDSSIMFLKKICKLGYAAALASSQSKEKIRLNLEKLGVLDMFNFVVAGEDCVFNQKPAPDIFIYAAGLADVPTFNCLVIEDLAQGIQAAKAAGMKCAALQRENNSYQNLSGADYVVNNLLSLDLNEISKKWFS